MHYLYEAKDMAMESDEDFLGVHLQHCQDRRT